MGGFGYKQRESVPFGPEGKEGERWSNNLERKGGEFGILKGREEEKGWGGEGSIDLCGHEGPTFLAQRRKTTECPPFLRLKFKVGKERSQGKKDVTFLHVFGG